jgi:3-oxoacyl-[acyl-carrier-protein] synthase II
MTAISSSGISRPFDAERDGFMMGEGAGMLVLEDWETAQERGATILAEILGGASTADAHHITAPSPGGVGAISCMQLALEEAGLTADQIGHVNAHGTSTPAGDIAESNAAKLVLGSASENVRMSSTKSMIGHLLGAAGAVEAIFSVLAIRDQVAPPTINLDNPSSGCDLNYVAHQPQEARIQSAMSNSFGFGGTNGTLIFTKI